MQEITPVYDFTVEQEGEYSKFIYKKTPVSYAAAAPLCMYTFIPAIFITGIIKPETASSVMFTWLFSTVLLSVGVVFLINFLRKPGEFKISEKNIIADNKTYQLDHVSSFVIKDPAGLNTHDTTILVQNRHSPFSMAGNAANLSNSVGNLAIQNRKLLQKYIQNAGYKIVIRYGSKEVAIAKGLGELEVDTLFSRVTEIAGYTKSN